MQTKTEKRWENFLITLIMFIGGLLHSSTISFFIAQDPSSWGDTARIVFIVSVILLPITMIATFFVGKKYYQIQKEK
jgi:uncharacterized membrane protein